MPIIDMPIIDGIVDVDAFDILEMRDTRAFIENVPL
jgi:hypothetical protein